MNNLFVYNFHQYNQSKLLKFSSGNSQNNFSTVFNVIVSEFDTMNIIKFIVVFTYQKKLAPRTNIYNSKHVNFGAFIVELLQIKTNVPKFT